MYVYIYIYACKHWISQTLLNGPVFAPNQHGSQRNSAGELKESSRPRPEIEALAPNMWYTYDLYLRCVPSMFTNDTEILKLSFSEKYSSSGFYGAMSPRDSTPKENQ